MLVVLVGFLACMACLFKIFVDKNKLQKWPGIPEIKFISIGAQKVGQEHCEIGASLLLV